MQCCPLSSARDALVDADGLKVGELDPQRPLARDLPALWDQTFARVGKVLTSSAASGFSRMLEEAVAPVAALIKRDADLAIFQVVRQDAADHAHYGVSHSMHAAIAARLAAQRLGWDPAALHTLFKAALTMNLSILELQGRLAVQPTPLTPAQREAIQAHPVRSVERLQAAGITDQDWLGAVAQHHELPSGKGYPHGLTDIGEMASLLRRADIYTAKLSARSTRSSMRAHEAARLMFVGDQGHPMAAALVKEFGLYPPGCCVRLASGEVGMVVKRGDAPTVACILNPHGEPLPAPIRRGTGSPEYAIVDVLNEKSLKVRLSRDQLAAMTAA